MSTGTSALYRALFCTLHKSEAPIAPFKNIPHWISPARALLADGGTLDSGYEEERVYVAEGCFYSLSSAAPGEEEIEQAIRNARAASADYVLFPCIRQGENRAALIRRGFLEFPWFIESVYRPRIDVENDLREQTGGRHARTVRRQLRKHYQSYSYELYPVASMSTETWIAETFDRLHRKNLEKYGHSLNFYNREVLETLAASEVGRNVFFYFCRSRDSGQIAQALLGIVDSQAGLMQLLVQGMDPEVVRPGDNIYFCTYFDLYRRGLELGVRDFRLGRGGQIQKRAIGANQFHVLLNYLLPISERPPVATLEKLRLLAERKMEQDLCALANVCKGEGYSLPTSWK